MIFTYGIHSNKIKDLQPHLRIWARILLRCVHHRKSTNSSDYINGDKKYVIYYIDTENEVNLHALIFQCLRDIMKETINGSKKMRNWIPLGRPISNILMESKLIDSLTEAQFIKELEPQVRNVFNAKSMKSVGIISEVKIKPTEIPKEDMSNIMIPLEDFSIFLKPYPMDFVIGYLNGCQANVVITSSETPSKKKREIAKKHSERMAKNFKASSSARTDLDNSVEEPNAEVASPSARIIPCKSVPS